MIDVLHLEKYQENNRIEAKRAQGGFPHSFWETYSAFANTLGGVVLLGVEERKDKSLHAVGLPNPEKLLKEFWQLMKNGNKANVNILADENARIEEVDGKKIIVITVPRAKRCDKPVFITADPFTGSYRRNGEGDYRCTKEEVQKMLSDAARMAVYEKTGRNVLLTESEYYKEMIVEYLTEYNEASFTELAELLEVKSAKMERILSEMIREQILICESDKNYTVYMLKS